MKKAKTPKGKGQGSRKKPKPKARRRKPAKTLAINKSNAAILIKDEPPETHLAPLPQIAARKAAFLTAMAQSLGVAAKASVMTGIPLRTHRYWQAEDEQYRLLVAELKDITLDFYEDALHELIRKGNSTATIFALKTQGKRRGWIETVHNLNQTFDDNNVTTYEIPDNGRDVSDAQIVE